MSDETLSITDVAKLLQDPSPENRAKAAMSVGKTFSGESLSEGERAIAEDIFRAMLADAAVRVRSALSESLKENPNVPQDVAVSLAKDVDDVALPMIASSSVLSDEDLIAIVETRGVNLQKAVALRENVSSSVADKLADTGNEDVVAALVGNNGADISEETFGKVLDEFGESEKVNGPMAMRNKLPIGVSERLVTLVSEKLQQHILSHHEVSPAIASDLLLESREKAIVSLLDEENSASDVIALVNQLYNNNRLTPTLVLRALCMGDTTFLEVALAKMSGIPVVNAYQLVHDKGDMGLTKLFKAAKMPPQFVKIARAALDVADEMVMTGGDNREHFKQIMLERVLTAFELIEVELDSENIDYLIGKLQNIDLTDAA